MTAITNITVKDAANADVVLVAEIGSAGDKTPARWSVVAASATPAYRPRLSHVTGYNANRTTRVNNLEYVHPVTATVNGVETVIGQIPVRLYAANPQNLPQTHVDNAVTIATNAFVSGAIRAALKAGYAPTGG